MIAAISRVSRETQGRLQCVRCGQMHERAPQRYCRPCHAAYMREWRKTHPPSAEERLKQSARALASYYERKGTLKPKPCEECGASEAEKHHPDYDKPLEVIWLCKRCHNELHNGSGPMRVLGNWSAA